MVLLQCRCDPCVVYDTPCMCTKMSYATYNLWCFIEGDNALFPVVVQSDEYIHTLQKSIKVEKETLLKRVDSSNLVLFKARRFLTVWVTIEMTAPRSMFI